MQNSKLVGLFSCLNKNELKRFIEFVSSPYFNKNSKAVKLAEYIAGCSGNYNSEKLNKEIVYSKIYPGKSYNNRIMKNLMTNLIKSAERFLEQNYYEKNTLGMYNNLLEELLHRKQYSVFSNKIKQAESLSKNLKRDELYFYNNLNLFSLKHAYELRKSPGLEKMETRQIQPINYLISFFLIWYFKYNYNLLNSKLQFNFEIDLNFIDKVIEYVNTRDFEDKPIVLIYYYSFMSSYKWTEDRYFNELKKLTDNYKHVLSKSDLCSAYIVLHSHALRKTIGGDDKYKNHMFEISKLMVLEQAYSLGEDEIIHPLTYKNIVKSACYVNNFYWAQNFINSFRKKLLPEFQNNVYNYCLAYCSFERQDYEKSLEQLALVKYENVYDKSEVKRLMMKIYYKMNFTEEFISLADTYKHFLHNDRIISDDQKSAILNFINFLITVSRYQLNTKNEYNALQLKNEIENSRTYEKDWLRKEINKLIEKNRN